MAEASLSLAEAASRLGLSPAVLAVLWQQHDFPTSGPDAEPRFAPADVAALQARIASHEIRVPDDLSALESISRAAQGHDSGDDPVIVRGGSSPTDSQVLFDEPVPINTIGGSQTVVVEGDPNSSGNEVRVESGSRLDADSQLLAGEEDDHSDHHDTLQGDMQGLMGGQRVSDEPASGSQDDPILQDDVGLVGGGDGSQTDISVDEAADDFLGRSIDDDEVAVEGGGPPSSQQRDIHEVLGGPGEGPRTDLFGNRTVIGEVPEDSGQDIDVNIRDFGDFGREEDPFGGENFGASGMQGFGGSFLPGNDDPHPYEGLEDDELPLPFDNNDRDSELEDDLTDSILAIDESSGSADVNLTLPGDSLQGVAPGKSVNPPEFDSRVGGSPMQLDIDELDALDAGNDDVLSGPPKSGATDLDTSMDPARAARESGVDIHEMSINFDGAGSGIHARSGSGINPFEFSGDADDFGAFDSPEPASRGADDILSSDEAQSDLLSGDLLSNSDVTAGELAGRSDLGGRSDLLSSDVPSGVTLSDEDLRIDDASITRRIRAGDNDAESLLGLDEDPNDDFMTGPGRVSSTSGADLDLLDLASQDDEGSVNSATDEGGLTSLDDVDEDPDGALTIGSGSGVNVGADFDDTLELSPSSRIDVNEDFNEFVSVSEITTADQLAAHDSGITLVSEEDAKGSSSLGQLVSDDDDEFVLGGSGGSDITLAANESGIGIGSGLSGIGLAAMSGSGIDLATASGLETSPSSLSGAGQQDQEFLLEALKPDEDDESDSGSQVIALDQDSVEIETAPTMLGADGFGGAPVMLGGDPYAQPNPLDPAAGMAAGYGAAPGYAPTPGLAPVVYQTAEDPVTFSGGDALLLSAIAGTMALSAILMFDLMRSVSLGSRSSILEWVFSMVG
ncbi:MAG TPA: hypothetical protein VGE52_17770 [Pirellulales bacterium]